MVKHIRSMGVAAIVGLCGLTTATTHGAVVLSFNNDTVTNPFNRNNFNATTSVSGPVTDATPYAGTGPTSATVTFANPVTARTVTNPGSIAATVSGTGTASVFNRENGGFGVLGGDGATTGRFNSSEAFTITSTKAFKITTVTMQEVSGDEYLNFSFTSGGNPISTTVAIPTSGYGAVIGGVFATTPVDANTTLTITNASTTGSSLVGRLRFSTATLSLSAVEAPAVPEPATMSLLGVAALGLLARRRRQM